MRNEDKERLNRQSQKKYLFHRLRNGCKAVWKNTVHKIILIFFYPAAILIWYLIKNNLGLEDIPLISPVLFVLVDLVLPAHSSEVRSSYSFCSEHLTGSTRPQTSFSESV